jgi:hypothetical protein
MFRVQTPVNEPKNICVAEKTGNRLLIIRILIFDITHECPRRLIPSFEVQPSQSNQSVRHRRCLDLYIFFRDISRTRIVYPV